MMNAAYITEQNKIASSGAWIWLLDITVTGYGILRFTNNNAESSPNHYSTTWNGSNYWSVPLSMDDIQESTSGEFPEYKLRIEEVDLASTLRTWVKATGGLSGSTVRLMVVHSDHLDLTVPAVDELAEILNCELTADAVTFTIGIPSLLSRRFPRDRYVPEFCRHKFAGALCQYVQPSGYSLTSSQISFIPGVAGEENIRYNTVWVNDGGLIDSVFGNIAGVRTCPGNLITNGSFESGVAGSLSGWANNYATSWDVWGPVSGVARQRSSLRSKFDAYGVDIGSGLLNAGILQTITGLSEIQYTLSCWVYTIDTTTIRMMTKIHNTYYSQYSTAGVGWEKLSMSVTPHSTNNGIITIWLGGEGEAVFDGVSVVEGAVAGEYSRYGLDNNAGFTIEGSLSNDGFFLANNYHSVDQQYVRVFVEADGGQAFVEEAEGEEITLTLGYNGCDHTLDACKLRDNTQNYGGSPGIAGGMYG